MKTRILKMLRESEGHLSGQELCERLGVSRTAVWKIINQLKDEGYRVEAIRNKGYRIVDIPDVVTKEEIESCLAGQTLWAGQSLFVYEEIDSTNVQAKRLGEDGARHGTLVVADTQTAGRGRRGKGWDSPPGSSIYMSLLLRPQFPPDKAAMLTVVMGYSVEKALKSCTDLQVQIKWPNDIVLHGKKLAGILTEMSTEIDCINYVTVGVGINVNMDTFPEELAEKAISLRMEAGRTIQRSRLIAAILKQFEEDYARFVKAGNLSWLVDDYNTCLVNCGREVVIHGEKEPYRAVALGINQEGELLVCRQDDGTEQVVFAGEVSVRGVYGYV